MFFLFKLPNIKKRFTGFLLILTLMLIYNSKENIMRKFYHLLNSALKAKKKTYYL